MKFVGLLTLYKRNYGSALQCYATKTSIEQLGYRCEVLNSVNRGINLYKYYVKEAFSLAFNSVRYKNYFHNYMTMRSAGKYSIGSLSAKSAKKLDLFCDSVLQVRDYSESMLKKLGHSDQYPFFVAGSDQVWSGSRKINENYFLRFAPKEKRIAFAPSFGTSNVADFNRKKFSKYLCEIPKLSVREEKGKEIVKELTGRDAERLADPTVLLDKKAWYAFAEEGEKYDKPYIFVHFLDKPSELAIEVIKKISQKRNLDILVFAYPHEILQNLPLSVFVDGSPVDYVSLIKNAELVCTDSFHSSLFSINLERKFLAFPRQYRHGNSQSSRLETLLKLYSCTERMITSNENVEQKAFGVLSNYKPVLKAERQKALMYLKEALKIDGRISEDFPKPLLKDDFSCTGCGACAQLCPKGAISMNANVKGYTLPYIDEKLCIKCRLCEKICHSEVKLPTKRPLGYIAYNRRKEIADKSASGGIFSALATSVIAAGGVVYGAAICFKDGKVSVKHCRVGTEKELIPLLGSKYVQSDCSSSYRQIKQDLEAGLVVLFCGTSCQVAGLYRYLGQKQYASLYTIDLICHGVPGEKLFSDYISYLETIHNEKMASVTFRTKTVSSNETNNKKANRIKSNKIEYKITAEFASNYEVIHDNVSKKRGNTNIISIPWLKSSYYRLFMSMNSYREHCYHCEFATIHKPANITVGDYFEVADDYPELYKTKLNEINGISCMLVHDEKGKELLNSFGSDLELIPADVDTIQASHANLCRPSVCSETRDWFFDLYQKKGFAGVEKAFARRDMLLALPKKLLKR